MSPLIPIAVLLVFVLFIYFLKNQAGNPQRKTTQNYRYKPTPIMTAQERDHFFALRRQFPSLHIFPQVAMSGIMDPDHPGDSFTRQGALWKIDKKRIDFTICDRNLSIICLIEIDDSSHSRKRNEDQERDSLTSRAGYKTIRIPTRGRQIDIAPAQNFMEIYFRQIEAKPQH